MTFRIGSASNKWLSMPTRMNQKQISDVISLFRRPITFRVDYKYIILLLMFSKLIINMLLIFSKP